jgi:plasmid stability protein
VLWQSQRDYPLESDAGELTPTCEADRPTTCAIIDSMSQLIVRNLAEDIVKRLRRRAAESGRSVEAEHREILREALIGKRKSLKQYLLNMPDAGRDEDFSRKRDKARKVRL